MITNEFNGDFFDLLLCLKGRAWREQGSLASCPFRRNKKQARSNRVIVFDWIGIIGWLDLNDVNEHTSPFNMAEELYAKACAKVCIFDEAGDISDDETAVA